MDVELHGLFQDNSTFDYDSYQNTELNPQFCAFVAVSVPILYSVGLLWGLVGNGLLLMVLWWKRRNWSVMDIFILHLCVSDVLLMLTLPLWSVDAVKGWIMGTGSCKLAGALFKINLYFGIFILALISLERYLSIVRGTEMFSRKHPTVVHGSCVIVWFTSLLLSIPDWIYLEDVMDEINLDARQCEHTYSDDDLGFNIRLLLFVVGIIMPTLVLLFSISSIMLYVQQVKSSDPQKKKDRTTCVFAALVLAFFMCWTAYNISFIVDTVSKATPSWCQEKRWSAIDITAIFGLLHCVVNPVIYLCFSKELRKRTMSLVKLKGCKANTNDGSLWECNEVSRCADVEQEQSQDLNQTKIEDQN